MIRAAILILALAGCATAQTVTSFPGPFHVDPCAVQPTNPPCRSNEGERPRWITIPAAPPDTKTETVTFDDDGYAAVKLDKFESSHLKAIRSAAQKAIDDLESAEVELKLKYGDTTIARGSTMNAVVICREVTVELIGSWAMIHESPDRCENGNILGNGSLFWSTAPGHVMQLPEEKKEHK